MVTGAVLLAINGSFKAMKKAFIRLIILLARYSAASVDDRISKVTCHSNEGDKRSMMSDSEPCAGTRCVNHSGMYEMGNSERFRCSAHLLDCARPHARMVPTISDRTDCTFFNVTEDAFCAFCDASRSSNTSIHPFQLLRE